MTRWRIPLSDLDLGTEEEAAVVRVIRSGWLTVGEEVAGFEREFAALCGADQAVALSSCTAALHLACVALGVQPGVEVIVPTMTFVATANAVVLAGGSPVFADSIGPDDFTVDPADVQRRVGPATRGIICVHYGGFPAQLDDLLELCARHDLFLIEDVAHAPGAELDGRALGTFGDAGCFSFYGNKNMTTGEGGMALSGDRTVAGRIRSLRAHGITTTSWDRFRGRAIEHDVEEAGLNYRPTELAAAVGRAQLGKLPVNNASRNALLSRYREQLASTPGVTMPFAHKSGAAHLAVVVADDPDRREALRLGLEREGVQTSVHYPPVHLFSRYRAEGHRPGELPVAETLAERALSLPLYASMTIAQVDEVCALVTGLCASQRSALPG